MERWLLTPPAAFIIILFTCWVFASLFSRLAFRSKKQADGSRESYACGEDNYNHMAQPDYSSFFTFAFFFTLAHVATLILITVPADNIKTSALAGIYIAAVMLGLYIILRRRF